MRLNAGRSVGFISKTQGDQHPRKHGLKRGRTTGFVLVDGLVGLILLSFAAVWIASGLKAAHHTARVIEQRYQLVWALDNTLAILRLMRFVAPGATWRPDSGVPSVSVTVKTGRDPWVRAGSLSLYAVEAQVCHRRNPRHCLRMKTLLPADAPR